jgi:peptide/nickel transport system permease protein
VSIDTTPLATQPLIRSSAIPSRIGLVITGGWAVAAIFASALAPHNQAEILGDSAFTQASWSALLGTDYLGRDVLSRLLFGARLTLGLATITTALAFTGGVLIGGAAGLIRGMIDTLISRAVDALMAFPSIMLALIVITGLGTSLPVLVGTIALIEGTRVFRLARALTMEIAVADFVEVARLQGEGLLWIIRKEILPNALHPLAADLGLRFTYAILFISALSFLGLGVQPPHADWGGMVRENMSGLLLGSLAPIAPAAAIASITIGVTLTIDSFLARQRTH